ncbi:ABC transporter permease [Chloroflexota bacterium]
MQAYIIRRLILMIPTIFLITVFVFATIRFIPGSVIDLMVAEMAEESGLGAELTAEYLREELGLDQPFIVQYGKWLGVIEPFSGVVQGNLGRSLWTNRIVLEEIVNRLPISMELGFIALLTGILISLPVGIYSAIRQDTRGDYIGRSIAILGISLPTFWVGTMVIVYPSIWWGWSPELQYIPFLKNPIGNLGQFLLPGMIQGMHLTGTVMRMTRTMMLEVLRQDYIRTAWAKGLKERTVVYRHALKNALIPVVSEIGVLVTFLIAGTVVIEQIFVLPGAGLLLIEALNKRDYPIISGVNLVLAFMVLFLNLIIDLSYGWFDPRVTFK